MITMMNLEEIIKNQGDEIQALNAQIISYQSELNTFQKRCDQYAQAYDKMQYQLKELLRNRFGKKSERFIDPEHPQFSLFEEYATLFSEAEKTGDAIQEDEIQVPAHSRKKKQKSEN